jgi:enamine deaminase RidA (YjgF/YER057c/UK114 family)
MSAQIEGPEAALARLEIELPPPPKPLFSYIPVKVAGGLAYVSGQVPMVDGEVRWPGHLGAEVSLEDGVEAARRCAIQALSALRGSVGSLDEVAGIVQLSAFVSSAPGFTQQPTVANGASDLLVDVFGQDAGSHARYAVGVPELPLNASVEIALIVELA